MTTDSFFNIHCGNEVVSNCCNASEHKWFPLMCSDCGDFSDFVCVDCKEIIYALTDTFDTEKKFTS
tara:strand:+ start:7636 stop:7833 length:198 start_codon:yes stop_codon:yes gene_type:complete